MPIFIMKSVISSSFRQPAVFIIFTAFDYVKKRFLYILRYWTGLALTDNDLIDRAYWSYFRCRPGKEHFIGDIKKFTRDHRFHNLITQIASDHHNRISCYSRQYRCMQWRGINDFILNRKK